MFDSHVHLLPGVDDGPKDFAVSLEMLERAKADGITHWIVTPHLNHACSQFAYDALKERFDQWRDELRQNSAYDNLSFGVEVYIDDEFISDISTMETLPTFENSKYMLIEFNRSTKVETMQSAVFELILRGVQPIIAHVEAYKDLVTNPQNVKALCDDGAMIQVSASTFLDKRYHKFIKTIMSLNAIDLVASDGHNLHGRLPILKEVYVWVSKQYSKEWANRLFVDSPNIVYTGRAYNRPFTLIKPKKRFYVSLAATAMLGVFLLVAGLSQFGDFGFNSNPSEIAAADDDVSLTDESMPAGAAEQGESNGSTASNTSNASNAANNTGAATEAGSGQVQGQVQGTSTVSTSSESTTSETTASEPTYDEVVDLYMNQLYALQNQYTADVKRIYNSIQDTRNFVTDEAKRKATIDAYLEEAGTLETICDENVYDVLYAFQNELESYDYDVAIIEESRAEYHRIKEDTKNEYLSNF